MTPQELLQSKFQAEGELKGDEAMKMLIVVKVLRSGQTPSEYVSLRVKGVKGDAAMRKVAESNRFEVTADRGRPISEIFRECTPQEVEKKKKKEAEDDEARMESLRKTRGEFMARQNKTASAETRTTGSSRKPDSGGAPFESTECGTALGKNQASHRVVAS